MSSNYRHFEFIHDVGSSLWSALIEANLLPIGVRGSAKRSHHSAVCLWYAPSACSICARPFVDIAAVSTAYVLIYTRKVRCTVVVVQTPHSYSHRATTTTTTISVTGTAINNGRVTDNSRRFNTSQQRNACVSLLCAYELTMVQWCEVCWYTQARENTTTFTVTIVCVCVCVLVVVFVSLPEEMSTVICVYARFYIASRFFFRLISLVCFSIEFQKRHLCSH